MTIKDVKVVWDNEELDGDLNIVNNDLEDGDELITAVLMCLFTDRRANDDDELPDPLNPDLRGWWGDLTQDDDTDQIGSRLWLLERSKTEQSVLVRAKEYAEESLQILVDDGLISSIEVTVERQGIPSNGVLAMRVRLWVDDNRFRELMFGYSVDEPDGGLDYLYMDGEKIYFDGPDYLTFGSLI